MLRSVFPPGSKLTDFLLRRRILLAGLAVGIAIIAAGVHFGPARFIALTPTSDDKAAENPLRALDAAIETAAWDDAFALADGLEKASLSDPERLAFSQHLFALGQPERVGAVLAPVKIRSPYHETAALYRAEAAWRSGALEQFNALVADLPASRYQRFLQARAHYAAGRTGPAEKILDQLRQLEPGDVRFLPLSIRIALDRGDSDKASRLIRRFSASTDNHGAVLAHALEISLREGRLTEVETALIEMDPQTRAHPEIRRVEALLRVRQDDLTAAGRILDGLVRDPVFVAGGIVPIRMMAAIVRGEQGDRTVAESMLGELKELVSDNAVIAALADHYGRTSSLDRQAETSGAPAAASLERLLEEGQIGAVLAMFRAGAFDQRPLAYNPDLPGADGLFGPDAPLARRARDEGKTLEAVDKAWRFFLANKIERARATLKAIPVCLCASDDFVQLSLAHFSASLGDAAGTADAVARLSPPVRRRLAAAFEDADLPAAPQTSASDIHTAADKIDLEIANVAVLLREGNARRALDRLRAVLMDKPGEPAVLAEIVHIGRARDLAPEARGLIDAVEFEPGPRAYALARLRGQSINSALPATPDAATLALANADGRARPPSRRDQRGLDGAFEKASRDMTIPAAIRLRAAASVSTMTPDRLRTHFPAAKAIVAGLPASARRPVVDAVLQVYERNGDGAVTSKDRLDRLDWARWLWALDGAGPDPDASRRRYRQALIGAGYPDIAASVARLTKPDPLPFAGLAVSPEGRDRPASGNSLPEPQNRPESAFIIPAPGRSGLRD